MKLDITGNAEVSISFLRKQAKTLDRPVGQAVVFLERQNKIRFLKEVDPDENKWAALSPATLRKKRTRSILRETSILANSISSEHSGKKGRVYTNDEKALWHQYGTENMPARPILGINEDKDLPKIEKIFQRHFGL